MATCSPYQSKKLNQHDNQALASNTDITSYHVCDVSANKKGETHKSVGSSCMERAILALISFHPFDLHFETAISVPFFQFFLEFIVLFFQFFILSLISVSLFNSSFSLFNSSLALLLVLCFLSVSGSSLP